MESPGSESLHLSCRGFLFSGWGCTREDQMRMKNWSSYQSYKDRKPPWVRLHKSLLDNYEFQKMSANARALLPMLWLLASEHKDPTSGIVDYNIEYISFRLRLKESDVESGISEIISMGFIERIQSCNESVTKPLRACMNLVTTETETETETETDKRETQTFEADVLRLKSLHLSTCGLISSPPLQIFRDILLSGKPITVIEDVYSFCGGDPQPYRQRNIVERLTGIRDGNAMFAVEEWGKAMSAEEMVAKGLIG